MGFTFGHVVVTFVSFTELPSYSQCQYQSKEASLWVAVWKTENVILAGQKNKLFKKSMSLPL